MASRPLHRPFRTKAGRASCSWHLGTGSRDIPCVRVVPIANSSSGRHRWRLVTNAHCHTTIPGKARICAVTARNHCSSTSPRSGQEIVFRQPWQRTWASWLGLVGPGWEEREEGESAWCTVGQTDQRRECLPFACIDAGGARKRKGKNGQKQRTFIWDPDHPMPNLILFPPPFAICHLPSAIYHLPSGHPLLSETPANLILRKLFCRFAQLLIRTHDLPHQPAPFILHFSLHSIQLLPV